MGVQAHCGCLTLSEMFSLDVPWDPWKHPGKECFWLDLNSDFFSIPGYALGTLTLPKIYPWVNPGCNSDFFCFPGYTLGTHDCRNDIPGSTLGVLLGRNNIGKHPWNNPGWITLNRAHPWNCPGCTNYHSSMEHA